MHGTVNKRALSEVIFYSIYRNLLFVMVQVANSQILPTPVLKERQILYSVSLVWFFFPKMIFDLQTFFFLYMTEDPNAGEDTFKVFSVYLHFRLNSR